MSNKNGPFHPFVTGSSILPTFTVSLNERLNPKAGALVNQSLAPDEYAASCDGASCQCVDMTVNGRTCNVECFKWAKWPERPHINTLHLLFSPFEKPAH